MEGVNLLPDEIYNMRTPYTRTISLGKNKYRKTISQAPLFYRDPQDGLLKDINLSPITDGEDHLFDKCPHTLRVKRDKPIYLFTGETGRVSVELTHINNQKIEPQSSVVEVNNIVWPSIAVDTDYKIIPMCRGVNTLLVLKSDKAPRKWQWETKGDQILKPLIGWDSERNRCQLNITKNGDDIVVEWTGKVTKKRSLRRGKASWTDEPVYPVYIDPSISENTSGADDVSSSRVNGMSTIFAAGQTSLYVGFSTFAGNDYTYAAGLRFQTINIPAEATIDSAVLTLIAKSSGKSRFKIWGDDVDDAPAFSAANLPKDITKTTAVVTASSSPSASASVTFDIQGVFNEWFTRAGFMSGYDFRVALLNTITGTNHIVHFAADEHAALAAPQLDVTYTVAGGGGGGAIGRGLTQSVFLNPKAFVRQ